MNCLHCGQPSNDVVLDETFEYVTPNKVIAVTAQVPGWSCDSCNLVWFGHSGEIARTEAVNRALSA